MSRTIIEKGYIAAAFRKSGLHFAKAVQLFQDLDFCCCCCETPSPHPLPEPVPPPAQPPLSLEIEEKLNEVMNRLSLEGIPPRVVREWLDRHVLLSSLRITPDGRIILEDFNRTEIRMRPLPKTVFLFYLRHPEGVDFLYLQDHKPELMEIYGALTACDDMDKIEKRITLLADPFGNGINEKCSAIKKAFTDVLEDAVARYYYVSGAQGDVKKILLDRSMVTWDGFHPDPRPHPHLHPHLQDH